MIASSSAAAAANNPLSLLAIIKSFEIHFQSPFPSAASDFFFFTTFLQTHFLNPDRAKRVPLNFVLHYFGKLFFSLFSLSVVILNVGPSPPGQGCPIHCCCCRDESRAICSRLILAHTIR
uniref:(northern house mosquito) hypothetical protein n=1 Tax=Culex pipiens TaxID=7175 RepID=A0A8D8G1X5_CULPI